MKERWRVVLACLVAALAVPFLVLNAADSAEGVETTAADTEQVQDAPAEVEPADADLSEAAADAPVEFVVTQQEIAPDVERLSARASTWATARSEAVEQGLVTIDSSPPSETDLSLLPRVNIPTTQAPEEEPDATTTTSTTEAPAEESPAPSGEGEGGDSAGEGTGGDAAGEGDAEAPVGVEPEEQTPEGPAEEPTPQITLGPPPAPAQVNGRVPPPAGGPTAEQWDALRFCESTHNYGAISPSGLYRGAYQFSNQTWDWVAGIHFEFLVGLDPAEAPPGWQDVMAYTLFAMRGWDQWPVCGTNLL